MFKLQAVLMVWREAERLASVAESELGIHLTVLSARMHIDDMIRKGADKSPLPLWMSAYLHLSRWHNYPFSGFAWRVSDLVRNDEQGYLKLNERLQ